MHRFFKICLMIIFTSILFCPVSRADTRPKYYFKIASLAPAGSVWAQRFDEFAEEVKTKTNGEVGFKVYPGGVMGDDPSVYRKMKIGQLQGGGFTMTGIAEIVPDFAVLGVPFLLRSYEEVDLVIQGVWPNFKKSFADNGLVLLGMSEVGFVYAMSTWPVSTVSDMKKTKCWVPQGDLVSPVYLSTLGVNATSLAIPDVLSSLQTGLIDTVFNSYYGSIVLQWFTQTRYVSDLPFAYSYGVFLLDAKSFSRLPADYAAIIESSALKYFAILLNDTRKSNADSLDVLKKNGVNMVNVPPESRKQLQEHGVKSVERVVGKVFSNDIYQAVVKRLDIFRNNHRENASKVSIDSAS
ncbi:MAG: TRAP transporter substrate-binding protein DctP [Proteobacteria bacterium]|nr:TRAP transporter substrate-binding protein DctP [Pseudomonadota bacterium]MBU1715775.1 TRAP transporter substrate-binding protein DctP [Pseudomonadota bacterium]